MESLKNNKNLVANIVSILVFLCTDAGCIVLGWLEIYEGLFTPTGDNVGETFETPVLYLLMCVAFYVAMYVLAILGIKFRNRVMAALPFAYSVIFIIAFVMLAVFVFGGIGEGTFYNIVEWVLVIALAPSFGAMWTLPLLLFVLMYVGLLVVSIVAMVKAFKRSKLKK